MNTTLYSSRQNFFFSLYEKRFRHAKRNFISECNIYQKGPGSNLGNGCALLMSAKYDQKADQCFYAMCL